MLEHYGKDVWSRAPITLRVYFAALLVLSLVGLALAFSPGGLLWLVFGSALTYLMLWGMRWVWILLVVSSALFLGVRLIAGVEWLNIGLSVVALALLLAPKTRRYFQRDPSGEADRSVLKGNRAVQAAAAAIGLFIVAVACWTIGGAAVYLGMIAILGMVVSAVSALALSVIGLFALTRE